MECGEELNFWGTPLGEAFNAAPEVLQQYIQAHTRNQKDKRSFYHYVGFLETQPVVSLTLSIYRNLSRIDDVGTLPPYQKKGYATEMIRYALVKSYELGARMCFLGAAQMGLKLYQNLGFNALFNINIFREGP